MKRFFVSEWPFLILLALFSVFYIWGTTTIPFHPDESTQIFMSSDFEALFGAPSTLFFNSQDTGDPRQRYRLIDAPLARYLIGFARSIAGLDPVSSDWDWGTTWDTNRRAGALPPRDLLTTARLPITLLFPFSLALLYLTVRSLQGRKTACLAVLLLAGNALLLLHARRAMAEGAIIFGTSFFLWSLLKAPQYPWLTGLAMALAFNAKQSTLALLPVGLLAVAWLQSPLPDPSWRRPASPLSFCQANAVRRGRSSPRTAGPGHKSRNPFRMTKNITSFISVFLLVTLLLNPVFWNQPVAALKMAILERQDLLSRQLADTHRLAPAQALDSNAQRALVVLANLYITPPTFYEVGNYAGETQASEQNYLAIPGHNLLRGITGGGILFFLALSGIAVTLLQLKNQDTPHRRTLTLLLLATLFQYAGLVLAVPLPWQRYVMPLVPFATLWSAIGLASILSALPLPAFFQKPPKHLPS